MFRTLHSLFKHRTRGNQPLAPFFRILAAALAAATILLGNSGCTSTSALKPDTAKKAAPKPYVDGPGVAEPTLDPAELCFANTQGFLRLKGLADHPRAGSDALHGLVTKLIGNLGNETFSNRMAETYGNTQQELFDRLFGSDLAVVRQQRDKNAPVIILSKAAPEDIQRLPEAVGASPWKASPTTGGFPTYVFSVNEASAGNMLLTVGTNWFFLCEKQDVEGLRKLLRASDEPRHVLADHPLYRRHAPRDELFGIAFMRNTERDILAATARVSDEGYEVDLFSKIDLPADAVLPSPQPAAPHPFLAEHQAFDFGPVPHTAAAVAALNVIHRKPKDLGVLDIPVIFSSVRSKILPGIEPPLIAAVVEVDAPAGEATEVLPAFALCARVDNASVAKALNELMGTFHFLGTLGALEFKRSLFGITTHTYNGTEYTNADFGDGITARLPESMLLPLVDIPEPAGLQKLSFGRIDDWFVICSQESGFKACVDAAANAKQSWTANTVLNATEFQQSRHVVATLALDTSKISTLVNNASERYEQAQGLKEQKDVLKITPALEKAPTPLLSPLRNAMHQLSDTSRDLADAWRRLHTVAQEEPAPKKKSTLGEKKRAAKTKRPEQVEEERKSLRSLREVSAALEHYPSITLQLWRGADQQPRARIHLRDQ